MAVIAANQEVQSLAAILETELAANVDFMSQGNSAYFKALMVAIDSVSEELESAPIPSARIPLKGPEFTPDEQEGVSVLADKKGDNVTGYIHVRNATPLFLSAKYIDIEKNKTHKHITSFFDKNLIAPSGFFSVAEIQDKIKHCKYVDCGIEIATPGVDGISSSLDVAKILAAKTVIEEVVYPIFSHALGLRNKPAAVNALG